MTGIAFKRIAQDESRIYDGAGDHVGDVYALDDPLCAGARYFVVHLSEDPLWSLEDYRGPHRVRDRSSIRAEAARLVDTHPLWG